MKQRETERVVQAMWNASGRTKAWNRNEIADLATATLGRDIEGDEVSKALQGYRTSRRRGFDVSAEGYGQRATWRVFGVFGHLSKRRRDLTEHHRHYVTEDSLRRRVSDHVHEVLPAAVRNGATQDQVSQIVLRLRSEVYATLAGLGTPAQAIPQKAEAILAPAFAWFEDQFPG